MRLWHRIEDQWYSSLDALDKRKIPVYSIIDPIDKIVPSLAVVVGLVIIGLFALWAASSLPTTDEKWITIQAVDETNTPLWGARITLQTGGTENAFFTNEKGEATLPIIPGNTPIIRADAEGYLSAEKKVDGETNTIQLALTSIPTPSIPVVFHITHAGGLKAENIPVSIDLSCPSQSNDFQSWSTTTGTFTLEQGTCDEWTAIISSPGYETQSLSLNFEQPIILLQPATPPEGIVEVVVGNASTSLGGMDVQLHLEDGTLHEDRATDAQGRVRFVHIPYGKYYVSVSDEEGNYVPFTGSVFEVSKNTTYTQTIFLQPFIGTKTLSLSVRDSLTHTPISDAKLFFMEKGKTTPSFVLSTNPLGLATLPLTGNTIYSTQIHAEGYLPQSIQGIGPLVESPLILEMEALANENTGTITIHVEDSFALPIAGAKIQLYSLEGNPILTLNPVHTDAGGNASLMGIPPGTYEVKGTKYPFAGSDSKKILMKAGSTETITLVIPLTTLEYFTTPGTISPEVLPPFFPCETDCLPPMIFSLEGGNDVPAFLAIEKKGALQNEEGDPISYATIYLSATDIVTGTHYVVSKTTTQTTGNFTFSIPFSMPGMKYTLTGYHPDYSPLQSFVLVRDGILDIQPAHAEIQLPYSPGAKGSQVVAMRNLSELALKLESLTLIPAADTLLNTKEMYTQWDVLNGPLAWNPLESKGVTLSGILKSTIPILSNPQEQGEYLLEIKSSDNQTWIQTLPYTVSFTPLGGCSGTPILLEGLETNPLLEAASFNPIGSKSFQFSNGCFVDGIPFPLQNLSAQIKWNGKPLGHIQLSYVNPLTGKKITQTLHEKGETPLLSTFWTQDAAQYASTLSFIPYSTETVAEGSVSIILRAQLGEGVNQKGIETSIPLTVRVTRLDSCMKVTPNPPSLLAFAPDKETVSFTIQNHSCGVPVDVEFCGESGNSGCSGGAPQGRITLSEWNVNELKGSKTIQVKRTDETLPGVYDITIRARTSTSNYERLGSVTVSVPSPSEYAFSIQKGHFSLYGKNARDATDVSNRLLEEPVKVTAAVCDWIEVEIDNRLGAAYNAYSITSAITTIVSIPAGGCGGPCLVLAVYVAILTYLFYGTEEVDLCEIFHTQEGMQDYIINLSGITGEEESLDPDALEVELEGTLAKHFSGEWSLDKVENLPTEEGGQQVVGVVLTNLTGYADEKPAFMVMALSATEHIHGDSDHQDEGEVFCTNSSFNNYKIGPQDEQGACEGAEDVTRTERFHIRIKTADAPIVSPLLVPPKAEACDAGFIQGYTGEGAVPRVAFNWRWDEEQGIPLYACDERNPILIYCDATQFNIDLMKRIRAVEEFLRANNYSFDCPDATNTTPDTITIQNPSGPTETLLGVNSFTYDFQTTQEIIFSADAFNQHPVPKDVSFTAYLLEKSTASFSPSALENATYSCTITQTLLPETTFPISCSIPGIVPGNYLLIWKTTHLPSQNVIGAGAWNLDTLHYSGSTPLACDAPHSTDGLPQWIDPADPELGEFVNENTVTYTKQVPSIQALNELLHFEARLIQDGYSNDFKDDFQKYYRTNSFADAPYWFKGIVGEPGYYHFYQGDRLTFRNRHYDGTVFPASGKYRVDVEIDLGEDWRFFDEDGKPKVSVEVNVVHVADPSPNSPFYRLPLNGEIGLENGVFDRKGYGVNFVNEGGFINLNDYPVKTYTNTAGNPYSVLQTKHVQDIQTTNTNPATRGQLLRVNVPGNGQASTLDFAPTLATPLLMRIEGGKGKPFTAFYQVANAGNPVNTGETLTYWTGISQCAALDGKPSYPTYYHSPDRHGKETDARTDWELVYGLDMLNPEKNGPMYLETILYTPVGGTYTFNAESSSVRALTPNAPSYANVQILDGIRLLGFNNASEHVNSIQDVFDLVSKKAVCVSDDGITSRFFWNPEQLRKEIGITTLEAQIQSLVPGETCMAS